MKRLKIYKLLSCFISTCVVFTVFNVNVLCGVRAAENNANQSDITLKITSTSTDTTAIRTSLEKIIKMANELKENAVTGDKPGQYSKDSKDNFGKSIEEALNIYKNQTAGFENLRNAVNDLVSAGSSFIKSVKTSNEIKDKKQNTLVYSTYRAELNSLVWEAKATLEIESELYTEGDKAALRDQITHAEDVLKGSYKLPFIRTRAFHVQRQDEDIRAAIEYYTMVPSYDYNDLDSTTNKKTYGLKSALKWYKSENIIADKDKLNTSFNYAISTAKEMLNKPVGNGIGEYPKKFADNVKVAYDNAVTGIGSGDSRQILKGLVKLYDAMREMRLAQVLRSDIEPKSNLYYGADNIDELKNKINSSPELKAEFDKIKAESDQLSLEDIQFYNKNLLGDVPNYEAVNAKFQLWTNSSNSFEFTTPQNAASITLEFMLPSQENEKEGNFGHVWIDDVNIKNGSTQLPILNKDFEETEDKIVSASNEINKSKVTTTSPIGWKAVSHKGNPVLRLENRPEKDVSTGKSTYAYSGSNSIFIQNPTVNDEGAWVYENDIAVNEKTKYSISYNAKIDGNPKEGVKAVIRYKDKDGNFIKDNKEKNIEFEAAVRKGSMFTGMNFNKTYQFDAIVYAVTGDINYAKKAKERMLWITNDMCNGIENWITENGRPFGIDAYGAVQEGRFGATLSSAYTLIKDSGVFSEEEYKTLTSRVDYILRDLLDLRDREQMDDNTAQANTSNWVSDMSVGTALLAMTFKDIPNSRQWLINAVKITRGQLQYTVNDDGSWPESIRYLNAVLEKFSVFSKAYRNATGEDWFKTSKLGKMFEFLTEVQTPQYEFMKNEISTPNFGDHNLTDAGGQFAIIGNYCDEIVKNNPKLGTALYETWVRAGKPKGSYGHENVNLQNFFAPSNFTSNNDDFELKSTAFKEYGLYMFRNNFKKPNESFFSIISNKTPMGHRHDDQGSFILYANSVPLVMDPGIESYFDATTGVYRSSKAHSTLQFKNDKGVNNTPDTSEVQEYYTSESMDFISTKIKNSKGSGTQIRNVAYVKAGMEMYIIWEQIKNASEGTIFNLPVAATSTTIDGNKATSIGHFNMDLETTVLQPENPNITEEWGISTASQPKVNGKNQLDYLRIEAAANENHLTVLYPKEKEAEGLSTEKLSLDNDKIEAYKIIAPDGKWVIAAVNNSEEEESFSIECDEALIDMKNNTTYEPGDNSVSVKGNGMVIIKFKP